MELDDQLAALAAGELDAADARALRARVAADPALAHRLARFERLHEVLTGWEAPPLSDDAAARLDAVVGGALAALGDEPLAEAAPARGAGLRALPDRDRDEQPVAPVPDGAHDAEVVDLTSARSARGVPRWVAGLGAVAAVLAVVGVGASVVGIGSNDQATSDVFADGDEERSMEDEAEESIAESDIAGGATDDAADEMLDAPASDAAATAQLAPRRMDGLDIGEGELLALAERLAQPGGGDLGEDSGDAPEDAADGELATCVDEALVRDSDPESERALELLATGTYGGDDAVFVVLRSFGQQDDTLTVFAYDPGSCQLLDSAITAG